MNDKTENPEHDIEPEGIALVVLGLVLPIAGFVWGPGSWWVYLIWLLLGGAAVWLYGRSHGFGQDNG